MKYNLFKNLLLIIVFLFIYSVYCQDSNNNQWIEDLDYLKSELPKKHYNLFAIKDQNYFNDEIESIKSSNSNLSDVDIVSHIKQSITKMDDSHTVIDFNNLVDKEEVSMIIKKELTLLCIG